MTLKEIACGKTVKVIKLTGDGAVKRRIMDMGITKGVEIFVRKVAPLGDPVEITVRGYELSLRKSDAQMILVEWFSEWLCKNKKCLQVRKMKFKKR